MTEKKFVPLSEKSLKKVWEWHEKNKDDPLSEMYLDACCAIGSNDIHKTIDRLKNSYSEKNKCHGVSEAYKLINAGIIYRDTVGKVILNMLKREGKS